MSDSERAATENKLRLISSNNHTQRDSVESELMREPIGCKRVGPFGTTYREAQMAKLLADGWDVTDAYRRAYTTKRRNVHREAHDIGKRIQVCQYVTALRAQKNGVDLHDGQVARDFIAKQLHDMAMNSDRDSDKLRALELMGKLDYVGAYRERVDSTVTQRTEQEIIIELKQRLTTYKAG